MPSAVRPRPVLRALALLLLLAAALLPASAQTLVPGTVWQQQTTSPTPPARTDAGMAYNAADGTVVLFGGYSPLTGSLRSDTWLFKNGTWTQQTPANSPSGRYDVVMTYDPTSGNVLLFGGSTAGGPSNETWLWNGTNWTQQHPPASPTARASAASASDTTRNNVLLFGGSDANGNDQSDTWTWASGAWTQRSPATAPAARDGATMAYDQANQTVVLFGGYPNFMSDTWVWNGTTWTQASPPTSPSGRHESSMAYDPSQGGLILFGGGSLSPLFNDTWLWNGTTWTQLRPLVSPSPREASSLVYNAALRSPFLFGGNTGSGGGYSSSDTWVFNGGRFVASTTAVGSIAAQLSIPFQVTGSGTLPALSNSNVLTQGTPGLDFQLGTGSTCTGVINAGTSCTVNVTVVPSVPGQRQGAVALVDGSGNPLATALVSVTGTGPQVTFPKSATAVAVGSGYNTPEGPAIDAKGNVFVANFSGTVVEIAANSGTQRVLATGFSAPTAVAVDGAGNVYVAESGTGAVKEIVAQAGSVPASNPVIRTLASGFGVMYGIAVDASGNVFITDEVHGTITELTAVAGSVPVNSTGKVIASGFQEPVAVAVDLSGNVYVADIAASKLYEIVAVNGVVPSSPTIRTLATMLVAGVAVDAAGDVFATDYSNGLVVELVAVNGSVPASNPTQFTVLSGLQFPQALTADGSGTLVFVEPNQNALFEAKLATVPSLTFADTSVGGTSSDSPKTISVQNNGNAGLTLPVPATGSNPSISSNFYLSATGSTACPQVTSTSPYATTLASGSLCDLVVSFTPGTSISSTSTVLGTLKVMDNNLNVGGATQSVSLTGRAVAITLSPAAGALSSATYGQNYSQTFTASGGTAPYGFSLTSGSLPAGLNLTSSGSLNGTPTAAGSYNFSITATDQGGFSATQQYTLVVNGIATTTTITGITGPAVYMPSGVEQGIQVAVAASSGSVPSGSVSVALDGGSPATYALTNGSVNIGYSGLPAGSSHTVTASYLGSGSDATSTALPFTFTIAKATATVTLNSLNQTYTGQPLSATATTNPTGLNVSFTYNGSTTAPTAAGNYAVVATVNDTNYQGSATGTLVINKAAATVTLGNLNQTYTGQPLSATATTNPTGLNVTFTYNGSTTAPTAAGNYTVVATVNDPNYQGTATGTLVISKAAATVTLGNLNQTYTGRPLSATATTTPNGLSVSFTYNGSATAPTNVGNYAVIATATDPNYQGTAAGTLVINKAAATVALGNLNQTYTGQPLSATATTNPSGVNVSITYNGSTTAPTAVGNYAVVATVTDPNYQGTATGTLVINKAAATISLGNLNQTYTGQPLSATATTNPTGLTVSITYNGSTTAPTAAGSYSVVGTVNDPNYQGTATGTLVIAQASATVTLGSLNQTYTGQPLSATATTNPTGLNVSITYNGSAAAPTAAGNYTVVATVNDTNYQGTATGTLVVTKATPTVATLPAASSITYGQSLASSLLSGGTVTYNGTTVAGTFAFTSPNTVPNAGTASQAVLFTPTDTADYSTVSLSVPVTVNKATATVTLGSLSATYDGNAHGATVSTTPAGLTVTLTYNGSATAPTAAGSYPVVATVNDANYAGSATGTLVIAPATATITFTVPNHTYGDAPFAVSASSASTGAFTYSVVSGPATINGNTVTLTGAGTVTLRASQAADANYAAGSTTASFSVAAGSTAITFTVPNHTYGDAPFTLSASSPSTGAYTYSVVSGPATVSGNTVSLTGAGTVTLRASQAADANYAASTQTATFTVSPAITVLLFPQPASIVYGTPLSATQLNATATASGIGAVLGTFSYTPATGTVLPAGTTTLTVQFTPANPANFTTPAAATTTLTITQAATTTVVTTSASPVLERVPVTFTVNVKTTSGSTTPTGTVTFLDGQTTLGTATLNASGVATYTVTSGFTGAGNHTITAAYAGNANQAASSGTVVQAIGTAATLLLTDAGQSSYSVTVPRSFAAQTTVTVTPGATFAGTISFSCSGLPANVSCEFTPSSITLAQGSSSQSVGLLIRSASLQTASLRAPHADEATGSRLTIAFALPGMLLAGLASRSRRLRGSQRLMLALFCVAGLATMAGLTGCGSGSHPLYSTTNAAAGTYTFNVVATSGTTTSTLPVTLTIQ